MEVSAELREALDACAAEAAAAWPTFQVDVGAFEAYVLERLPEPSVEALGGLHTDDLYLACACAQGDAAAIAAFEKAFEAPIAAGLARLDKRGMQQDDVRQAIREKLFTGEHPKITDYGGRGRLRNWVKITVLRQRIDAVRREDARPDRVGHHSVPSTPDVKRDPELAMMHGRYKQAFVEALPAAFAQLTAEQRTLLRQRLSDDLTTAQIAAIHGVHKATIKRWLADARERLLAAVRDHLGHELGLGRAEFESVMRLLQSDLDVSIRRYLDTR